MIKTRKILRKIVKTGAAEICLYLCSHIPDITRHKSINVSKRIKTLEVSETFDPLWSLLRGTQHLSESALMICRPQDILNFIVSILSIGLFSQSISWPIKFNPSSCNFVIFPFLSWSINAPLILLSRSCNPLAEW